MLLKGAIMDRQESANGLQLIKFGAIKLKGHFSSLFMGAFAMCTPLILVLGIPALLAVLLDKFWIFTIGVLLFVIMAGPLQIGYIKYFNGTIKGEQPKVSSIYSHFKFNVNTLKYIYFVGILFILYVLGFVLWIVPAGFAISFYSMVLFFQEKFEYPRFSSAFKDCSRKMLGNRLAMFSYKLIFYFVYFLLFGIAALGLCLIYTLSLDSILLSYIVTICIMIIFIFLYTMITVYYHSCNQIFFEDTLMYHERKAEEAKREREERAKRKAMQNLEAKTAEGDNPESTIGTPEESKKEASDESSKPVETTEKENVEVKPASAWKTTTRKSTTTKSATTKSTTKKPTTAKKSTGATKKTTTKSSSATVKKTVDAKKVETKE